MSKLDRERRTVNEMITIYERHKHIDCTDLRDYAMQRLSHCVFQEDKPTCLRCPIHCYKPGMRIRMKQVMRYSGPWMLLYHPILTIRHMFA